jgi:hypothetical protein
LGSIPIKARKTERNLWAELRKKDKRKEKRKTSGEAVL